MTQYPKFIAAGRVPCSYEKHIPAPYLRKSYNLDKKSQKAEITVSGLGFYRLFVNGKEITKGYLAPYISNSDDIVYFDKYDVTDLLTEGENVIGAILGNGMQNCFGGGVWDFHIAKFRSAPKLALRLNIDGEIFDTDESWKCADSPIFFDDLRSGCFYDANKEIDGWCDKGFDDSSWKNAIFAEIPRGENRICEAEPIRVQREIKAVSIKENILKFQKNSCDTRLSDAEKTRLVNSVDYQTHFGDEEGYLYDFGVNTAGLFRLRIKGEKGQRVILQAIEYLNEDGTSQCDNVGSFYPTGYAQRDVYILKGDGEEEFIPSFTYHGCQYCFVTGITKEQATESLVTFLEMNSDFEDRGSFECSDKTINFLQEMAIRSAKSNFYYFPTDCPHREKNGWTGDASYSAEYMTMNFATEKSFREWERNICKALNYRGELPGVVPTAGWGYQWGNGPAWDRVIVYIPYYAYIYRGDKSLITESAHGILRYLDYLTTRRNENGLFEWGLGDWCPTGRGAGDYIVPLEMTDSIMVMSICEKAAYLFNEVGMSLQADFAKAIYNETRKNLREQYIDFSTMTAVGNCQSAQAMCIFYDVFENAEKPEAFRRLLEFIEEKDGHYDCGYLGNRVIFHVLAMHGETELALNMITRPDYPSYVYPVVKFGATALWENYFDYQQNSLNHHFFGDISNFFIKRIAGLEMNPLRRDVNEYYVHPYFAENLSFAKAHYDAVAGRVEVKWEKENEDIILTITAPENSKGKIILPKGYAFVSEKRNLDGTRVTPVKQDKYIIRKVVK
ncbi:MAG: family 78 glycoside hydrolase catalytic domain [Clostridia bacterium]|nr:family 78 glycoside hydrolase catalytic domain [Clostridia bacterium]